jgi:hypothetical protein
MPLIHANFRQFDIRKERSIKSQASPNQRKLFLKFICAILVVSGAELCVQKKLPLISANLISEKKEVSNPRQPLISVNYFKIHLRNPCGERSRTMRSKKIAANFRQFASAGLGSSNEITRDHNCALSLQHRSPFWLYVSLFYLRCTWTIQRS